MQADEGLDGGARRILAVESTIEKRPLGGCEQRTISFPVDAVDEQIRVVNGGAGEGQHATGSRIHRDHGTVFAAKRALGQGLQRCIDGEINIAARDGVGALEHTQDPPLGVGFHLLKTGLAVE